jgi:MFS family permease
MKKIKQYFHSRFPTYGESNIKWFYAVSIFGNSWFQLGNWLLFVLLFMSEREFALYESIAFGIGILLEIPSGAIADLFGKKRTILLGLFMQSFGSYLFIFGYLSNQYFFIANIIIIAAFAFISGSLEALVYDTLVEKNKTKYFDDIIGKARSLDIAATVVASAIGGLLWKFSIYGPVTATAIAFTIALFAACKFIEPKVDTEVFSVKNFILQNKRGFYFLFRSDFRKYTFSFAAISGAFTMWSVGIIRILMGRDFGFDGESLSYLISATLACGFFSAYFFSQIRKKFGDMYGFGSLLLLSALAWLATGLITGSLILGSIVFVTLTVSGKLSEIWTSVILNKHVLSRDRATAISTLSFLVQIPYVAVVILYGNLIANNNTNVFYIVTGLLLIAGLISFWRAEKSNILVNNLPNV